jgi:hypothetical protein
MVLLGGLAKASPELSAKAIVAVSASFLVVIIAILLKNKIYEKSGSSLWKKLILQAVANFVLGLADFFLDFSGFLLGLAFGFGFLIAGHLTGFFLDGALHLLGSAFNAIFVHGDLLAEKYR